MIRKLLVFTILLIHTTADAVVFMLPLRHGVLNSIQRTFEKDVNDLIKQICKKYKTTGHLPQFTTEKTIHVTLIYEGTPSDYTSNNIEGITRFVASKTPSFIISTNNRIEHLFDTGTLKDKTIFGLYVTTGNTVLQDLRDEIIKEIKRTLPTFSAVSLAFVPHISFGNLQRQQFNSQLAGTPQAIIDTVYAEAVSGVKKLIARLPASYIALQSITVLKIDTIILKNTATHDSVTIPLI